MDFLGMLVEMALPLGFVVVVALLGKRIGGAGAWLLAVVAVVDALLIFMFRAVRWFTPRSSFGAMGHTFDMLVLLDTVAMFGCGFLVLLACLLLMPKMPTR